MKLQFTNRALNNLIEITSYYEKKQSGLGFKFSTYLKKQLELLEINPQIGRAGKVFGTREFVLQEFPFIAVYRVRKIDIQLLLVYHQSRNYP